MTVVKTKRDEHKWEKAKGIAEDSGFGGDWAYIMGIYKKMKPDYEFKNPKTSFTQSLLTEAYTDPSVTASFFQGKGTLTLKERGRTSYVEIQENPYTGETSIVLAGRGARALHSFPEGRDVSSVWSQIKATVASQGVSEHMKKASAGSFWAKSYERFVGDLSEAMEDPKLKSLFALKTMRKDFAFTLTPRILTVDDLVPTQNEIDLEKTLNFLLSDENKIKSFMEGDEVEIHGPLLTFNSEYILDGHHRWSQVFAANPKATMTCLNLTFPGLTAIEALKALQTAIAATTKGELPSKGVEGNNLLNCSRDLIEGFIELNLTQGVVENSGKDREDFIDMVCENLLQMQGGNRPIPNAPHRGAMPQLDEAPKALKLLEQGKIHVKNVKEACSKCDPRVDALIEILTFLCVLQETRRTHLTGHWNVEGDYGLHLLLERVYEDLKGFEDDIAERIVCEFGSNTLDNWTMSQISLLIQNRFDTKKSPLLRSFMCNAFLVSMVRGMLSNWNSDFEKGFGWEDLLRGVLGVCEKHMYLLTQSGYIPPADQIGVSSRMPSEIFTAETHRKLQEKFLERVASRQPKQASFIFSRDRLPPIGASLVRIDDDPDGRLSHLVFNTGESFPIHVTQGFEGKVRVEDAEKSIEDCSTCDYEWN